MTNAHAPSSNENNSMQQSATQNAMALALAVSVLILLLKALAYLITGSAAILSDATESITHLISTLFAVYCLRLSRKPADETHLYGHAKVAFLSTGFEGALICAASGFILFTSLMELIRGPRIQSVDVGTILTAFAALANLVLGLLLLKSGRKHNSLLVRAHAIHVLGDVVTTVGVFLGLLLVMLTNWKYWDPLCAACVGLYILRVGAGLIRQSLGGLLDEANPQLTKQLEELLKSETQIIGGDFHKLRHRRLGDANQVEYHLLLPAAISLDTAHAAASHIEQKIRDQLGPETVVQSHIEPLETHDIIHSRECKD